MFYLCKHILVHAHLLFLFSLCFSNHNDAIPDCNNKNEAEQTLDTVIPWPCTEECFVTYSAHLPAPPTLRHTDATCASNLILTAVETQLGERQASDLSSFMAVLVRTIWSLVIPRYEVLTGSWEGEVEPITMLETRSHPPEMNICMLLYIFLIRKDNRL